MIRILPSAAAGRLARYAWPSRRKLSASSADMDCGKGIGRPSASDTVWTTRCRFFSSPAAWTCGWLARICSTSVLPERGMPRTKIGDGRRIARSGKALQQAGVEQLGDVPESLLIGRFVVMDFAALQSIALKQMLEGARIVADVFQRLAERKVDIQHLAREGDGRVGGQCLERGEIGIARAKGLQIRAMVMRVRRSPAVERAMRLARNRCQRLVELALLPQHVAQVVVRLA